MAVALLFNTVSAGVAERLVEFGSLQAAGMGARVIAATVIAENMLLTALAIVPGLFVGWLLARAFMAAYQSDQFSLGLNLQRQTLPLVAAGVLVCAALAQSTAFRAIQRIDIARIVRERST